jgi:leucyl/phenylalanyl-tRNA---protein transferase
MNIFPLSSYSLSFPNPLFCQNDEGIIAYGGDLSIARVIKAYTSGIFPWYKEGDPILWWSPNPRMVLYPDDFKISKSLLKTIKKNIFEFKINTAFEDVIINCSNIKRANQKDSWIVDDMVETYCELYNQGYAYSFESWCDGELVGGGYGLLINGIFSGESMFSFKSDASKVALYHMINHLKDKIKLIDCKIYTPHLNSLGAITISRDEFLKILRGY